MHPGVFEETEYCTSTYPFWLRKKICTPLLACKSVSDVGSVGLSELSPGMVEEKVLSASLTATAEVITFPDAARKGVLKYAYSGTVSFST